MSKQPTKQEQLACDIALCCMTCIHVFAEMGISTSEIGVVTPEGAESLADIMARLRDAVQDMVMEGDSDSKALAEQLLAKVGAA
jgi:hypothetical protein